LSHIILFDIDGTLVLTGGAGGRAMRRAFREVFDIEGGFDGIPMSGRTDLSIIRDALKQAGLVHDNGPIARLRDRYVQHLAEALQEPHPRKLIMPGVRELLDVLQRRDDVFLALLTGNFMRSAQLKLEHFDLWRYFRCGAFADDAEDRNQLLPVALERAARHGAPALPPEQVIVVGDTPLDVECAAASGARAVAVATGSADVATLRACGADVVFEDLTDTSAFLALLR
jgi:phosphoglycolate phosphatase